MVDFLFGVPSLIDQLMALVLVFKLSLALGTGLLAFFIARKVGGSVHEPTKNYVGALFGLLAFYFVYFYFLASLILTAATIVIFYFYGGIILAFMAILISVLGMKD